MGWPSTCLAILALLALVQEGQGLYCRRCYSAMGGCGESVNIIMFPWRDCGDSTFCVKVVEKWGSHEKITRECESVLMKNTRHRLRMPVLRRHGYCIYARKNDPYNPWEMWDRNIKYCFCNDFNACNTSTNLNSKVLPVLALSSVIALFISKLF